MDVTYDPVVDALTIQLRSDACTARTARVHPGILVDFDAGHHPITIEILDASRHFARSDLRALPLPLAMITLAEAAREIGLAPATLRQQIRRKRLRATKRHREWWVDPAALEEYLRSRAPQGRRSHRKPKRAKHQGSRGTRR